MKRIFNLVYLFLMGLVSCNSQSATTSGFAEIDVPTFRAKMAEPDIVLLDVRTPAETAKGKIADCQELDVNADADGFGAGIDKLDKSKTYLVYCRSGVRSAKACKLMAEKGFKNLYSLQGGYLAWTK